MARHGFRTEAELAARVVEWLKAGGWQVYQEVDGPGGIADIVAVNRTATWVIECKLALTLHVLEQAHRWLPYSFLVSVAVPHYVYHPPVGYRFGCDVAYKLDIGVIKVRDNVSSKVIHTPPNRRVEWDHQTSSTALKKFLFEQQQTFSQAGSPHGKRWTPFKKTVQNFTAFVKANPGCTVKEMCSKAEHHYKSFGMACAVASHRIVEPGRKPWFPEIEARQYGLSGYKLYCKQV